MLKLLLLSAVLTVIVTGQNKLCKMTHGHVLHTFSGTKEPIKFACKIHAVRGTVCGKYTIIITPGLNLVPKGKDYIYAVEKMFISVTRTNSLLSLAGRMSTKTVRMFLAGHKDNPFVKKDGYLTTSNVYTISSNASAQEVTLREKDGDFSIQFSLYNGWEVMSSSFSFQCHSSIFIPTQFPHQLCGNRTKDEVEKMSRAMGLEDGKGAVTALSIFGNEGIAQTNPDCQSVTRIVSKRCRIPQMEAARLCSPVVYKDHFLKCLTKYNKCTNPTTTFNNCVEFACSNFRDPNSCYELALQLEGCPTLDGITNMVKKKCPTN